MGSKSSERYARDDSQTEDNWCCIDVRLIVEVSLYVQAMASFMEKIRGGRASFDPERVVLTAGATAANELLTFILADPGDALLVPTPYYPG